MIDYLRVENLAVVEKSELCFSPGLNVLSGETGAGKSILVDAILLFLQKRVNPNLLRSGKERLIVEALFRKGEDELILRREVEASRSLCFINNELVTIQQLNQFAATLFNIYGQRDYTTFLQSPGQLVYLDQFVSPELRKKMEIAANTASHLSEKLKMLESKKEQSKKQEDYFRFQLQELEELGLQADEEQQIKERTALLSASEEIKMLSQQLISDLYEREESVYLILDRAVAAFQKLKNYNHDLEAFSEKFTDTLTACAEVSRMLASWLDSIDSDPNELNRLQFRLDRIERLKKKYQCDSAGLLKKSKELKTELDRLESFDQEIEIVHRKYNQAFQQYCEVFSELRKTRELVARRIEKQVISELKKLEMPHAQFSINFLPVEPDSCNISPNGSDQVEFFFSSNPDQPLARIRDVASGGEISRLMLVFKSICPQSDSQTYIFDEIDSGIGGKTAEFVGDKLRQISLKNQVICISHLPQIASFADRHFLIIKEFKNKQTFSYARLLSYEERLSELARMMAGSAISEETLQAAARILEQNFSRN